MSKHPVMIYLFVLIGIIFFAIYELSGGNILFFIVVGPPIYFANAIKEFAMTTLGLSSFLQSLPRPVVNDYVFLFPATLLYYGAIGFLLQQLQKEHGFIRHVSLIALFVFLGYIHYKAWVNLTGYIVASA
ncbi:MAG TPA: hypothetical protein VD913_03010 [bacterium]|nr:hypothetical protein [bacterium]